MKTNDSYVEINQFCEKSHVENINIWTIYEKSACDKCVKHNMRCVNRKPCV